MLNEELRPLWEVLRERDGCLRIDSPGRLRTLLAFADHDLSTQTIDFLARNWRRCGVRRQAEIGRFLELAVAQVVDAGILPAPRMPLLSVCTEVEAIMVGGKPGPASKYGAGVVQGYSWDSVFRIWRIEVVFSPPAGCYYGRPIRGSSTFVEMLHVVGSGERPLSTMTPAEIESLYEIRRQAFWRAIDPASGLSDPAGIVPPRAAT